jgi:hypothetical protein
MVRCCSHLTQPLSWSTTPCQLSTTAYLIYSQLPSILEAVPPSATWGRAIPWWQVPIYLGYIAYYDGFIITNDSEDILTVCIINTTAFFLLDMFHAKDHHERSHIMPCNFHCKFYVLRALQLSVRLKDMYNSCCQVYGIYMHVKIPDYT